MKQEIIDTYELVVGLEVHAQLSTKTKAFSPDANAYGEDPNTNISVITLAHPGTLPKSNGKALEYSIKMGLACGCEITRYNIYDRKNYFYPDLPKGFQITQDKAPICVGGYFDVENNEGKASRIRLNRIHMEEDAGKSIHLEGAAYTMVDLNRAGVPLIEIVTEPDIRYPEEAIQVMEQVRRLVRYLEISDGNMEEGSLRCDANVSVRKIGDTKLGRKVEVKNMNSMRNVQKAIEHEKIRQIKMLEAGEEIISETRTFNPDTGKTYGMRTKEELNDYRYFPEPDLPPIIVSDEMLERLQAEMPPLPKALFEKFTKEYKLPAYDAGVLTDQKELALYFEEICSHTKNFKAASNWLMTTIKSYLNDSGKDITEIELEAVKVAQLIALVDDGKVSNTTATSNLFKALINEPSKDPEELAKSLNLIQESNDGFIVPIIDEVLARLPDKVAAYKKGKKNLIGLFMGEVMKAGKGKVDPKKANELIRKQLEKA
ncbi:MAG: Asp-tRNA(Asn)/Glu-tRNA(Gln) amidotransferase GatCAB subunit B [Thalassobius sp.]|nr:Asp-tRNA(Asn)/Glu-tRNA(Gln) amidotransferase GatCAB subunit B [Thalassovita sp.]